jgi:hypothetical protein
MPHGTIRASQVGRENIHAVDGHVGTVASLGSGKHRPVDAYLDDENDQGSDLDFEDEIAKHFHVSALDKRVQEIYAMFIERFGRNNSHGSRWARPRYGCRLAVDDDCDGRLRRAHAGDGQDSRNG